MPLANRSCPAAAARRSRSWRSKMYRSSKVPCRTTLVTLLLSPRPWSLAEPRRCPPHLAPCTSTSTLRTVPAHRPRLTHPLLASLRSPGGPGGQTGQTSETDGVARARVRPVRTLQRQSCGLITEWGDGEEVAVSCHPVR